MMTVPSVNTQVPTGSTYPLHLTPLLIDDRASGLKITSVGVFCYKQIVLPLYTFM